MGLADRGYELLPGLIPSNRVAELLDLIPAVAGGDAGRRDLYRLPWIREFATGSELAAAARDALGEARVVRILFFDKQPGSNWKLPYHQDLTIAVAARADVPGYGPWSVKDGIVHVQPPGEVLESMVAVRLHLDDCGLENGALRLIPGSHRAGKIAPGEIEQWAATGSEEAVEARAGDALLMRPLTLHASSPARSPSHRRVLHIEYATATLSTPLEWRLGWPV